MLGQGTGLERTASPPPLAKVAGPVSRISPEDKAPVGACSARRRGGGYNPRLQLGSIHNTWSGCRRPLPTNDKGSLSRDSNGTPKPEFSASLTPDISTECKHLASEHGAATPGLAESHWCFSLNSIVSTQTPTCLPRKVNLSTTPATSVNNSFGRLFII